MRGIVRIFDLADKIQYVKSRILNILDKIMEI